MTPTTRFRSVDPASPDGSGSRDHRWAILAIIGVAQLMVVLDTTIVNIALPSAQQDLGFGTDSRQWIITAYSLAFGSLLLLGGRLSDLIGRRTTLLVGLFGFAGASALGGAAPTFALLVGARSLQGVFAAVLAPAALSTLNVTFTDAKERGRAFGIYAAIASGGSVVGLIVGGMLTEWLSWRWCLYVNLLFALPAAAGVMIYVRREDSRRQVRLDLPGVLAASGALFCLVYGLSNAAQHSWGARLTITMLAASAALFISFIVVERHVANPLLPLRVVTDRNRGGSYVAIGLAFTSMFGSFLFLTYFLQQNLGYSPLKTGVAFLPMTAGIVISAGLSNTRLLPRFGPRPLVPAGFLIGACAMYWLAQLSMTSTYGGSVAAPMFLLGLGVGLAFAPSINTATAGIAHADAGIGSAMVNTSQQIGGAIGTAVLSTIFSSALKDYVSSHRPSPVLVSAASIHGYAAAFAVCAWIFLGGALLTAVLLRGGRLDAAEQGRDDQPASVGHLANR
jgi:EmrB/QacA subfamily drug resistance transporter